MKSHSLQQSFVFFFAILLSLGISACGASRKLAADFVNTESKNVAVLLLPSDYFDYMYEDAEGNVLPMGTDGFAQAEILPQLSDSIFLESYYNSFIDHLEQNEINVFTASSMTDFLNFKGKAYLAEVAQLELIEQRQQQEVEELHAGTAKIRHIALRALQMGLWLEVSAKDAIHNARNVYYAEGSISDQLEGDFVEDYVRNDAIFHYQIDSISSAKVYQWAAEKAQEQAEYLYDLMMNTYIWNHLSEKQQATHLFLHYDPQYRVIERADKAFEMIDE